MANTRVLLIHNTLWSHYKGIVFSELHSELEARQIDLRVVHQALTEGMRIGLGEVDLSCHRYPYVLLERGSLNKVSVARKTWRLLREMLRWRADVVVIPGYADSAYWAALAMAIALGQRRILAFDSTLHDKPRRIPQEWAKRLFVACFAKAFCYGRKSKEYLEALGVEPQRIKVRCQATANQIIEEQFRGAAAKRIERQSQLGLGERNFIYVGRLSPEKNLTRLLNAFAQVEGMESGACKWGLILVGDGPEREGLEALVKERNVQRIAFSRGVKWDEVPKWLALADVAVLPSLSEPWGLVANEAMACGLPVIISSNCGAADDLVIDGRNGIVFDARDGKQLTSALARCVNNIDEVGRMGRDAKRTVEEYNPRNAALQMVSGIEEVLVWD